MKSQYTMRMLFAVIAILATLSAWPKQWRLAGDTYAADAPAATRPVEPDRTSTDVSMIASWIVGGEKKPFERPFGDRDWIIQAKDALFYTDVDGAVTPAHLKRVPYDFIKARMQRIQGGHKVDPAVLITRSIEENPAEGMFGQQQKALRKPHVGERWYYVEVAIGNMAWHWIKFVVYEEDGRTKVESTVSAVS